MSELRTAGRRTVPRVAALALGALFLAAPASARAPENGDAWNRLANMERLGVQRDPYWAYAYWAEALAAPEGENRIESLRWTLRFDPEMVEARWALCRSLARARDPECANQLMLIGQQTFQSFLLQQQALLWILTLGGGALLAVLVLATLASIFRTLPRIHHGIHERLLFLPGELRGGAALLTLLLPIAIALTLPPTALVLWILLLGTVGAWPLLKRPARRRAVWAIGMVLLAPVAFSAWSRVAEPLHPGSYVRALWNSQGAADGNGVFRAGIAPASAAHDPAYYATLALAERRAGRYGDAINHLERAIELAPDRWTYHNNLGNTQLLAGDVDGALASYERAQRLAPGQPLVHVNEAQAWMRKLSFTRADQALHEATRLGYRMPRVLNTGAQDIIVRDEVMDAGEVWMRFGRGELREAGIDGHRLAAMILAPLVPLRPVWMSLVLVAALAMAAQSRRLPVSHACAGCGKPICRKCHYRVLRRSLCSQCNAIRIQVRAPLKREEMLRDRRRRVIRWPSLAGTTASLLFPGIGHLLSGAPRRALFSLFVAMCLLIAAGAGTLWPFPQAALAPARGWTSALPFVVYALLALGSARAYLHFLRDKGSIGLSGTEER